MLTRRLVLLLTALTLWCVAGRAQAADLQLDLDNRFEQVCQLRPQRRGACEGIPEQLDGALPRASAAGAVEVERFAVVESPGNLVLVTLVRGPKTEATPDDAQAIADEVLETMGDGATLLQVDTRGAVAKGPGRYVVYDTEIAGGAAFGRNALLFAADADYHLVTFGTVPDAVRVVADTALEHLHVGAGFVFDARAESARADSSASKPRKSLAHRIGYALGVLMVLGLGVVVLRTYARAGRAKPFRPSHPPYPPHPPHPPHSPRAMPVRTGHTDRHSSV